MVYFRTRDLRWIWRYRIFYIAGIIIMSVQIFLGVIFFVFYEEIDRNSSNSFLQNVFLEQMKLQKQNQYAGQESYVQEATKGSDSNETSQSGVFGLSVVCNVTNKDAISAITRAKTPSCKQLILNITCGLKNNSLFPEKLPHFCPNNGLTPGKYLGCFRDNISPRLLSGAYYNSSRLNSHSHCLNKCVYAGFSYAGVQFGDECFCGNEEPLGASRVLDSQCTIPCPSNSTQICGGFFTINIFETGIARFNSQKVNDVSSHANNRSSQPIRIVFLLTLNGRSIRHVYRLIKILFHRDHFFFIHVDARQDYLFRELLSLELRLSNVVLSRRRHSTIWGGASLLIMLLQSMSDLVQSSWDWDYLINLSESDFPIKTNKELVNFLSVNRNRNFVKSHGRDVHQFIHKQGLDKTFVECDDHMWRIGKKVLPYGIVIDGGSDWIALSRPFINYVVTAQNDQLVNGLRMIFKYTLLPAESFFHTMLRNSAFCDTYIDNNLHVTNWKRHLGCKCQYKNVVDWCGCSPNVFTPEDWYRIQATVSKPLYFARKFDPVLSQGIINRISEWLYGRYTDEFNSERKYWQNVYHHLDRSPAPDDAIVSVSSSLCRQMLRLLSRRDLMCSNIVFNKLLQVHSFYEDDVQKGILVNFLVYTMDNESVEFEVKYNKTSSSFTLHNSSPVASRFVALDVNTNFDAKEKISRNYVGAIGPFSEPVLIYHIIAGPAFANITVMWVNPVRVLVEVSEISIDELIGIHHMKPNLKTPLLPGKWTVYLIHSAVIVATLVFAVSPLELYSGLTISSSRAKIIHSGSEFVVTSPEWNHLLPLIQVQNQEILKREAELRASYVGSFLTDWIDGLIAEFYHMENFCIVSKNKKLKGETCLEKNFPICGRTLWSSFSPDPKTHITTVHKLTGRLN